MPSSVRAAASPKIMRRVIVIVLLDELVKCFSFVEEMCFFRTLLIVTSLELCLEVYRLKASRRFEE